MHETGTVVRERGGGVLTISPAAQYGMVNNQTASEPLAARQHRLAIVWPEVAPTQAQPQSAISQATARLWTRQREPLLLAAGFAVLHKPSHTQHAHMALC